MKGLSERLGIRIPGETNSVYSSLMADILILLTFDGKKETI